VIVCAEESRRFGKATVKKCHNAKANRKTMSAAIAK